MQPDRMDTVIGIQTGDRGNTVPRARGNAHSGAECHQDGRGVTGGDGVAASAIGSDAANLRSLFEAVIAGVAPEFRLVVVVAARIQAKVAAKGAHLAEDRKSVV